MEEFEKRLMAVTIMALDDFSNLELAALNAIVSFTGRVPDHNIAHARALEYALINQDGSVPALYELRTALAHVINRRVGEGTFI